MLNLYGDISPRTAIYAVSKLLRVAQPMMVTQRFAQVDTQPNRSSNVRKWRRYNSFPVSTAPLQEGVTPPGHALSHVDITAVLRQYGDRVNLTDVIQDTHEDPVLQVMMERTGEQASHVVELITIDVLKSGVNVIFSGNVNQRIDVNAPVSRTDIRLALRGLNRSLATKITSMIAPSAKISTKGVDASFFAFAHTDLEPDLENCDGWKAVVEYGDPNARVPGEVGAIDKVRFITTTNFTPWYQSATSNATQTTYLSNGDFPPAGGAPADVYPILIFGKDAYAVVRLQSFKSFRVMVLNPGVPRGGDELGQRGSVGWKTWYAAAILNEQWLVRIECCCTANPV
jgi:N4-gp56 family major capsid protein